MNSTENPVPSFKELVSLRVEWRALHAKQEREQADLLFDRANIARVSLAHHETIPTDFRDRLQEFGREWERALVYSGMREGYTFYRAEISIEIDAVTALPDELDRRFESTGAALFFESRDSRAIENGAWNCLFYFALRNETGIASIALETLPGLVQKPTFQRIM